MTITEIESLAFEQSVKQWIFDAVGNGATTFEQLIKLLPSVDPIIAFKALQKNQSSLPVLKNNSCTLVNSALWKQSKSIPTHHQKSLPSPHPLDYDWRFTDSTVEYLLQKCAEATRPYDTIVLLGTPSLLRVGTDPAYQRSTVLLDANTMMTTCLSNAVLDSQIVECNLLRDILPNLSADAVVMDPPWYPEHIQSFLWDACQFCKLNGHILISLPPIGTRPGIEREWQETLAWANQLGLQLIHLEELSLSYLTPLFERNVFRISGVHCVPQNWRRGNLAIFTQRSSTNVPRPIIASSEKGWLEVNLFGVRIRVRPWNSSEFVDPSLISVIPSDVLTSVSRRDPRRQLADVWTSGNRIFSCLGRGILWHVLDAISRDCPPHSTVEAFIGRALQPREISLVSNAIEQVLDIINLERKENLLFEDHWSSTNFTFTAS
ncbi:hypothetical protein IQ273_21265 [Nodosilinea sp. LEGE 07298]|uniref:hypothetical protein n=1 Tax=Nodosilinea sp. LEGE 07298 TaxID=2777970 RepID=UPI0018812958|nr:hypothetical protein [Nodosilinea sp. LEGE 07298]MBE9111940.1 hypothetical protein [Nodosilinea sp. LEGE 07298]